MKKLIHKSISLFMMISFLLILLNGCTISPNRIIASFFEKEDTCDIYISDYKLLEKIYQKEYKNYEFQPGEVIAEIGAANLFFSLSNMCFKDSLTFYVQDLNIRCLSEENIQKGKEHFTKLRAEGPLKGNIYVVQGDTNHSNLPKNTFDKVVLRLVYHEFKNPEQNLKDIYEILKPDGILYIGENVQKKQNKMKKCGLHRTQENLIQEIENEGFKLEKIVYKSKNENYKVFKFVKK